MSPFKCPLYIFLRVTWLFRSLSVLVNTARWNTSLNACIGLNFHFAFPSLLLIHHRNLKSPEPLMHSLQLCFLQTPGMFLMMLVMSCVTQRTCKIPLHCRKEICHHFNCCSVSSVHIKEEFLSLVPIFL